ncbi:MAG: DUF503 domain-containing protein [Deltaproteobacteria bacterium]|nr:DUF503 domain-containing protein [Deltaproteobacteria bacterium]
MFVAVGRLSFHLAGVSSLKGKRSVVRKMVEKARARFNVAIAEVDDNDEHRKAVIGVGVIGNSSNHVDATLSKVCSFIIRMGLAEVVSHQTEVISLGDNFGEDRFFSALNEKYSEPDDDVDDDIEDWDE